VGIHCIEMNHQRGVQKTEFISSSHIMRGGRFISSSYIMIYPKKLPNYTIGINDGAHV